MTAQPMVSIAGVNRRFATGAVSVDALIDVNAQINPGEITVIAGPSGSGKTTLLSILAGHETSDSGQIAVHPPLPEGARLAALNWAYVGYVPQTPALLDELTVAENIELPNRLLTRRRRRGSTPSDARVGSLAGKATDTASLMARLQIDHLAMRYPSQTSGGEQQRTAIARALRLAPPLLIADEPTGHQDRARVHIVLDALKEYARSGRSVVIASHDDDVIASADTVIQMLDGRLQTADSVL